MEVAAPVRLYEIEVGEVLYCSVKEGVEGAECCDTEFAEPVVGSFHPSTRYQNGMGRSPMTC